MTDAERSNFPCPNCGRPLEPLYATVADAVADIRTGEFRCELCPTGRNRYVVEANKSIVIAPFIYQPVSNEQLPEQEGKSHDQR